MGVSDWAKQFEDLPEATASPVPRGFAPAYGGGFLVPRELVEAYLQAEERHIVEGRRLGRPVTGLIRLPRREDR